MDINQMRYFVEICNTGSMSKAADNLHMSQQGLSISIRRLEDELNCDLFYRKPSGLILTEFGRMLKTEALEILDRVNYIYEFCAQSNSLSRINVSATMNMLTRIPLELQHILLSGTDELEVNLIETWTCDCEDMVSRDEANFGLVYGECDPSRFDIVKLDMLKQVFIVNKQHPLAARDYVTLQDLDNIPLIIPQERCRPGKYIRRMFQRAGVNLNIAYECDRPRQTIDVVINNPTLASRIILDDVSSQDLNNVKILALADDPFLLPICLINKKGRKLTMKERFFQHLIVDSYRL